MSHQAIIRNDVTFDRPQARITTDQIHDLAKTIDGSFTTCDLSDLLVESGKCRGMSYAQIERAVRGAMSWLVLREIAYVDGQIKKITDAGVISKPFVYRLYLGRTWDKDRREAVRSSAGLNLLERALGYC
uniref:Uncharacterized protein n=1 Tax=Dechloromonas aromatica (strain RCB) TaxID=159087 RepID=Q47CL3_DECAR